MIPVPLCCLYKLEINQLPNEYNRVHTSKELAFCRRKRDGIPKQAQKTYNRVLSGKFPELNKNSCDFKLLEEAYILYCKNNNIEINNK